MNSINSINDSDWARTKTVIEEYRGLSADPKPALKPDRNGSVYYEMDTRNVYMYDGENLTWIMQ